MQTFERYYRVNVMYFLLPLPTFLPIYKLQWYIMLLFQRNLVLKAIMFMILEIASNLFILKPN